MANKALYVGSVTNAMRGKQVLEAQGIPAYVRRANGAAGEGCGFSLLVTGDARRAEQALRSGGVRIIRTEDVL